MTTSNADPAVHAALARLQESPRAPKQTIKAWLDTHQADVIILCMAKGQSITADLLGLAPPTLSSWKHARNLTFVSPNLSRDGRRALTPQNLRPPRLPSVRGERVEPPTPAPPEPASPPAQAEPAEGHAQGISPLPETPQYILGQRDAFRFALHLLGAGPVKYVILEDGRVVELATGNLVAEGDH